jgi:sec-independent protein translocase protein TatB
VLGINPIEAAVLVVLALLIFGPEGLPKFAADAGRFLRDLRTMAQRARADVTRELGPEFENISLRDLDPKRFAAKHLLGPDDFDLGLDDDRPARNGGPRRDEGGQPVRRAPGRSGERRTYEPAERRTYGPADSRTPDPADSRTPEPAEPAADGSARTRADRVPPPYDSDAT